MGTAEMCALLTGGAAGLVAGTALGAAAAAAARHRRRPGVWRITDEVSGTRTRVLLVRQHSGLVTRRVLIAEIASGSQDWPDAYLAAHAEAVRRLEWLQAREAVA